LTVLLGDADRELLYERLKQHAAAGRISVEELERRVAIVHEAQTREQAATALKDLPPLEPGGAATRAARPRWGRGHGDADRPAADWEPTPERFRDPRSGRVMRVWMDGAGGRHYVPDDERP
jgi:Domain of unknown function (DUF1707)